MSIYAVPRDLSNPLTEHGLLLIELGHNCEEPLLTAERGKLSSKPSRNVWRESDRRRTHKNAVTKECGHACAARRNPAISNRSRSSASSSVRICPRSTRLELALPPLFLRAP